MLRVAVPNKGALSESASEILSEAGYRRRTDPKDLPIYAESCDRVQVVRSLGGLDKVAHHAAGVG